MRKYIDLIENALSETERLDERVYGVVEIQTKDRAAPKNENGLYELTILKNPNRIELLNFYEKARGGLRAILSPEGNIYLWDAYYADHATVKKAAPNIKGANMEVRDEKELDGTRRPCCRLFVNKATANNDEACEQIKNLRVIQRLFRDTEWSIGALRW